MRVVALQIRTVAVILMVFVVALLFLNSYFQSGWIWLTSIALVIVAVIVYFIPTLRKWRHHSCLPINFLRMIDLSNSATASAVTYMSSSGLNRFRLFLAVVVWNRNLTHHHNSTPLLRSNVACGSFDRTTWNSDSFKLEKGMLMMRIREATVWDIQGLFVWGLKFLANQPTNQTDG